MKTVNGVCGLIILVCAVAILICGFFVDDGIGWVTLGFVLLIHSQLVFDGIGQ